MYAEFKELLGKVIVNVNTNDECVMLMTDDGVTYEMKHFQDCCESVYLADVTGSWDDIIGQVVTDAFENFQDVEVGYGIEGWTFYTIETFMGAVTLRWNGSSNGYYSISVDFYKV